jgi:hypothetical protein
MKDKEHQKPNIQHIYYFIFRIQTLDLKLKLIYVFSTYTLHILFYFSFWLELVFHLRFGRERGLEI